MAVESAAAGGWPRLTMRSRSGLAAGISAITAVVKSSWKSMLEASRTFPAQRPLKALGDPFECGLLISRLPEGTDQQDHRLDRTHAFAAYVPDDEPYAVPGVLNGIEVSADMRIELRRPVARRDLETVELGGRHRQYGELRRLGDVPGGGEIRTAAMQEAADDDSEKGYDGGGRDLGDVHQPGGHLVEHAHGCDAGDGGDADQRRAAGREEGSRDEGRRAEQRGARQRRSGEQVQAVMATRIITKGSGATTRRTVGEGAKRPSGVVRPPDLSACRSFPRRNFPSLIRSSTLPM